MKKFFYKRFLGAKGQESTHELFLPLKERILVAAFTRLQRRTEKEGTGMAWEQGSGRINFRLVALCVWLPHRTSPKAAAAAAAAQHLSRFIFKLIP